MLVFFDTSAFVKRYIRESGTDQVLDWQADVFISADKQQCAAAIQTGLRVESLF
jgi:hypothetical protein